MLSTLESSPLLSDLTAKLFLDHRPQRRQVFVQSFPDSAWRHIFVVVAIEVTGRGYFSPRNARPASLQLVRQAPRCLGNDLKTADDGIESHKVVAQALESLAVRNRPAAST